MIKLYIGFHVKYTLFLSDFNEFRILSTYFRRIFTSNFKKIRPLGARLFHAGGLTDRRDVASSRLSQFCESTYKDSKPHCQCETSLTCRRHTVQSKWKHRTHSFVDLKLSVTIWESNDLHFPKSV